MTREGTLAYAYNSKPGLLVGWLTTPRPSPPHTLLGHTLTCLSQAEGPELEVRGCVGDAAQAVLSGVHGLVDKDVSEVEL